MINTDNLIPDTRSYSSLMTAGYSEFLNFPFLRDQLFISFFKALRPNTSSAFDEFILKAQVEYYCKFINPNFDPKVLDLPQAISKCPFASKMTSTRTCSFAMEPLSKVRYSFIENVHISDMNLDGLTVGIIKPGNQIVNCPYTIFTSGCHQNITFNDTINIIASDASFSNLKSVQDHPIYNEIISIKDTLSASDILFFFPSNTLIINPQDIDMALNILVYLNLSNIKDISVKTLKAAGITCKGILPSQFEAYSDVLTIEYIRTNSSLFM